MTVDALLAPAQRDWIGISCSAFCIGHCASPLLLALLGQSLAGSVFFGNERLHLFLLALVPGIAAWSLIPAYRLHADRRPLVLAAMGVLLLFTAVILGGHLELAMTISGGLCMIAGHLLNRRGILAVHDRQGE